MSAYDMGRMTSVKVTASASAAPPWVGVMAFGLVFIVVQVEMPFKRERE